VEVVEVDMLMVVLWRLFRPQLPLFDAKTVPSVCIFTVPLQRPRTNTDILI